MQKFIEAVPNFSEGYSQEILIKIANAITSVKDVHLLDIDSNIEANRSVYTIIAKDTAIEEAVFRAIKKAAELIDMRQHQGVHPCIGATDVCPLIPFKNVTMDECIIIARQLGERVGDELKIPVYLYEKAAFFHERSNLANCRRGKYAGLKIKLQKPHWKPDYGPSEGDFTAGLTVIGARNFLIAYNVNLNTSSKEIAQEIAEKIRESGNNKLSYGKLKTLKAIGWYLNEYNFAQVSTNITNFNITPLHLVYNTICEEADKIGVQVAGSELVGLIPLEALLLSSKYYATEQNLYYTELQKIELVVKKLGLNQIRPFNIQHKILEYAFNNLTND